MRILTRFVVAAAASCLAGLALAAAPGQGFPVPDHGTVTMPVPADWRSDLNQPPGNQPPTVLLKPRSGPPFQMFVALLWPIGAPIKQVTDDLLKQMTTLAAQSAEAQSVEGKLEPRVINGAQGSGYYFKATNKVLRPGEFKYLTQGVLQCGSVTLGFTIMSNEGQEATLKTAMDILTGARN
jgi:hypothetical protein